MKLLRKTFSISFLFFVSLSAFSRIEEQDIRNMDEGLVIERISNSDLEVTVPEWVFSFSEAEVKLRFKNPEHTKLLISNGTLDFIVNGENRTLTFDKGEASFRYKPVKGSPLSMYCEEFHFEKEVGVVGSWVIIAPAVLLLLAVLRRVTRKRKAA